MMRLFGRQGDDDKVRFIAMMESGALVDEMADVMQTQVIAPRARASVRNRAAVPVYDLVRENSPPVFRENAIIESGMAMPPGLDSRFCLADSYNLFHGIKSGAVDVGLAGFWQQKWMLVAMYVAAIFVFVACMWYVGIRQEGELQAEMMRQGGAQAQDSGLGGGEYAAPVVGGATSSAPVVPGGAP